MTFLTESRPRSRWLRRSLLAVLAAGALTVGTISAAPAAMAEEDLNLGPTLVETGAAPSGYAMKFRYRAPEGVQQVHVYGDWTYSRPENMACQDCGDGRPPAEWQPGDVAATQWHIPMGQGADGVWDLHPPLPAGTFRYAFTHDCASSSRPAVPCTTTPPTGGRSSRSTRERPARYAAPSTSRAVGVPDVRHRLPAPPAETRSAGWSPGYTSPLSTNPAGVHDIVVYLPHGYDPNRASRTRRST